MKGKYILINDEKILVSDPIYKVYKHFKNKEEYVYRKKQKGIELSLDSIIESGAVSRLIFNLPEKQTESNAIKAIYLEKLYSAIRQLEPEERELIQKLFFDGISLRELSRRSNIPTMTLHARKMKVLDKLKKNME